MCGVSPTTLSVQDSDVQALDQGDEKKPPPRPRKSTEHKIHLVWFLGCSRVR